MSRADLFELLQVLDCSIELGSQGIVCLLQRCIVCSLVRQPRVENGSRSFILVSLFYVLLQLLRHVVPPGTDEAR